MVNRRIFWICIVLLLMQISACSGIPRSHWPVKEGQVVDRDTGQPIDGALVIALWRGYGGYGREMCFHVETVKTNEQGNYRIPAWRDRGDGKYLKKPRVDLVAYKAGYNYWGEPDQATQYLKKFEGGSSERIAQLGNYVILTSCYIKDSESEHSLYIKDLALYEEAKKVATTMEDKYYLIDFLYGVERHNLDGSLAYERAMQRTRELGYEPPECSSATSIRTGCRYKVPEE